MGWDDPAGLDSQETVSSVRSLGFVLKGAFSFWWKNPIFLPKNLRKGLDIASDST